MLVTDSFVFLHIPKTGGTFIQSLIEEHLPVEDYRPFTHTPYDELPERWRRLPVVCVVRNPWDWYVSWFHFQSKRGPQRRQPVTNPWKRGIWEDLLRSGDADFSEVVTRACTGDFDHPVAPMARAERIDLYSAFVKTIAGTAFERPDFTPLRFERLRKSLLRSLEAHTQVTPELRAAIRRDPPLVVGRHGPYPDYYDEELAMLVGEKARWLCERFDYEFGSKSASSRASS